MSSLDIFQNCRSEQLPQIKSNPLCSGHLHWFIDSQRDQAANKLPRHSARTTNSQTKIYYMK